MGGTRSTASVRECSVALVHFLVIPGAAAVIAPVTSFLASANDINGNAINFVTTIASTGIVGVVLLMILFRVKIMPTYVYDEQKAEWERLRAEKDKTIDDLKNAIKDANSVYTEQVIPTLTRTLDAERELIELRRDEREDRRRRGE